MGSGESALEVRNRNVNPASDVGALNPSIALTEPDMHNMRAGKLRGQSANINRNAALTRRGIDEGL